MYRSEVHYDYIRTAVRAPSPSWPTAMWTPRPRRRRPETTGARGVMIGRGCIRNPWLFEQIRAHGRGQGDPGPVPSGRDVLAYVHAPWEATEPPESRERLQVEQMKRYPTSSARASVPTPPPRLRSSTASAAPPPAPNSSASVPNTSTTPPPSPSPPPPRSPRRPQRSPSPPRNPCRRRGHETPYPPHEPNPHPFDSKSGNVARMAELVAEGARSIPDTEVRIRSVTDATAEDVLW